MTVLLFPLLLFLQPSPASALQCPADCNRDGRVTAAELQLLTRIAAGASLLSECPSADSKGDGKITDDEIRSAVSQIFSSCDSWPTATPTFIPSATAPRTLSPTSTPTLSQTPVPTATPSRTPTPTSTLRATITATATATRTKTTSPTFTATPTVIPGGSYYLHLLEPASCEVVTSEHGGLLVKRTVKFLAGGPPGAQLDMRYFGTGFGCSIGADTLYCGDPGEPCMTCTDWSGPSSLLCPEGFSQRREQDLNVVSECSLVLYDTVPDQPTHESFQIFFNNSDLNARQTVIFGPVDCPGSN